MSVSLSFTDRMITSFDRALKTLIPGSNTAQTPNPAGESSSPQFDEQERRHVAGLMRINHAGEVCAQGLYQGQALTAKLEDVRETMDHAADEEIDHLVWCEQRLKELGDRPSLLNPAWYGLSLAIGAVAGVLGDRYSLGFVAATEEQVCKHLRSHLEQLPIDDQRSRKILEQMLEDEARHATVALQSGGLDFPAGVKEVMTLVSGVMTKTVYRI